MQLAEPGNLFVVFAECFALFYGQRRRNIKDSLPDS
jgi:hypothetical protein